MLDAQAVSGVTVHPRACGGNENDRTTLRLRNGPSPRLRGKLLDHDTALTRHRSIPAPAGETDVWGGFTRLLQVHPRACGETRKAYGYGSVPEGSIPAPAGETEYTYLPDPGSEVHPRACGGNGSLHAPGCSTIGPSPRLAGETIGSPRQRRFPTVHPRACGGNGVHVSPGSGKRGPSPPPAGGNGSLHAARVLHDRSIPAPAGETIGSPRQRRFPTVHPRACGGNRLSQRAGHPEIGPSPRLRGKPILGDHTMLKAGSIPAPAGETDRSTRPGAPR